MKLKEEMLKNIPIEYKNLTIAEFTKLITPNKTLYKKFQKSTKKHKIIILHDHENPPK